MDRQILFEMNLIDAGERLYRLLSRLEDLRHSDYLSDTPLTLIKLFTEIGRHLLNHLVEAKKRFEEADSDQGREEAELRVRLITDFVTYRLFGWIDIIELARPEHNPQELVASLDWLVSQIHWEAHLILCPYKWQPVDISGPVFFPENYAFIEVFDALLGSEDSGHSPLLRQAIGIERAAFAAYPQYLGVLLFANPVRDNFLQHAALGHELGHFADRVHQIKRDMTDRMLSAIQEVMDAERKIIVEEILDTRLGHAKEKAEAEAGGELEALRLKLAAYLSDKLQELNDNWQGEIVADVFAIRLFGPAAFFSIAQYLLTHLNSVEDVSTSCKTHPSTLLRARVMLRELGDLTTTGILGAASQVLEQPLKRWRELVADLATQVPGRRQAFNPDKYDLRREEMEVELAERVYTRLEEKGLLAQMQQEIRQRIQEVHECQPLRPFLPTSQDFDEVPYAAELLRLNIPPSEKDRDLERELSGTANPEKAYLSLATILNAGWVFEFEEWRDLSRWRQPDDVIKFFDEKSCKLDSMIRRAIEQSEFLRQTSSRG
jgi:hypothetical protein